MIGHLYRYPHPTEDGKFMYVGQGAKRDSKHRLGKSSFGRRFNRAFPTFELPQPIREEIDVENQQELNELETIWMFQYHTWHGYGGMNLIFPGSLDYQVLGLMSVRSGHMERMRNLPQTKKAQKENGHAMGLINGPATGRKNAESGHMSRLGKAWGSINGIKNAESGLLDRVRLAGSTAAGKIAKESGQIAMLGCQQGRKNAESGHLSKIALLGAHTRCHLNRGIVSPRCSLCQQS